MKTDFHFTFENIETQLNTALELGYKFITCEQYALSKDPCSELTTVLRVDIDLSCKKALRLMQIFDKLGLTASFFVRLHAPQYNPFDFENYRVLKAIRDSGHEIGYHSEIVDQAAIWGEDVESCLRRDIDVLNRMLNIKIKGIASHGGMTGLNNLDFWKGRSPSEFGLLYEAYDNSEAFGLFEKSIYVSDSEWNRWKCYDRGELRQGDKRSFEEHAQSKHPLIYLLIHSDTFFDNHFYE